MDIRSKIGLFSRISPVILAGVILVGCGRQDPKPVQKGGYKALPVDAVLMRVNGAELTKGALDAAVSARVKLWKIAGGKKIKAKDEKRFRGKLMGEAFRRFEENTLFAGVADEAGYRRSDDLVSVAKVNFARSLGGKKMTFEGILSGLTPDERAAVLRGIDEDLKTAFARKTLEERFRVEISDAEVDRNIAEWRAYNIRMAETNRVIFARATNLWQAVASNRMTFEDAANRYSEAEENDHESNGDWGEFDYTFLYEDRPQLAQCVGAMKVGDVSAPIEGDNGLMILKLTELTDESGAAIKEDRVDPRKKYHLARIFFRLPEFWTETPREEFRKELAHEQMAKKFDAYMDAIEKAAKIEFPHGEDVLTGGKSKKKTISREEFEKIKSGEKKVPTKKKIVRKVKKVRKAEKEKEGK